MGGAETGRWSGEGAQQEWGQDFRGKGPRGYRRSDQRIHEEVCDALTDDPHIDASNMEVTVKDGEVTLSGAVSSREEKRMAEDLVERISGVKDVTNNLRVQQPQQQQQAQGQVEKMTSPPARH
jgi:osmotically-inducible protein OsmY